MSNLRKLKNLYTSTLQIGATHVVWNSINTQAEFKKGVIKARVLKGVYILQSNRHSFGGGVVEPTCQLCFQEDEDVYHLVTRCPAYYDTGLLRWSS